jgi:hypothetical protein
MVANLTVLLSLLGTDTKCIVTTGEPGSPLGIFAMHTNSPVLGVPPDVGRFEPVSDGPPASSPARCPAYHPAP